MKHHRLPKGAAYSAWNRMRQSCTNPLHKGYADHGAKGIKYGEEFETYPGFFSIVGQRPSKSHCFRRINPLLDFTKDNVHWTTNYERKKRVTNPQSKSKLKLYSCWSGMLARCKPDGDKNYGRRGIRVYQDWHNYFTFIEYVEKYLGERPDGCSIDRIDVNGNYEPGNIRWATKEVQASNKRLTVRNSTGFVGVTLEETIGIHRSSFRRGASIGSIKGKSSGKRKRFPFRSSKGYVESFILACQWRVKQESVVNQEVYMFPSQEQLLENLEIPYHSKFYPFVDIELEIIENET